MAKSNRDRIGDVMDALRVGLAPFVLREYKQYHKGKQYLQEVELTLTSTAYSSPYLPDEATAIEKVDIQGWLNLMVRQWDVFRNRLGKAERSYAEELREARNKWAHQEAFTNDEAYRVVDTATRLLEAIGATNQANQAREIASELLRLRYDAEQKQSQKKPIASNEQIITTTTQGLRPWRMVVKPHPDVSSGRYILAEFVADLAQVIQNKADPEYGDPKEFFRRTYLTEGLLDLLVTGVRRITGGGGDPVVQLQTSFGGGKTHSMLAMYHLLGGGIRISDIPDGEHIIKRVGNLDDTIQARRAVIVGTAFSATEPKEYPNATVHTLWGEIAYQIGGIEAYRVIENADLTGVSPGADTLLALLEKYGPALIIIDELVAYARNLYGTTESKVACSFDSVMTFFQALTEAVKRSPNSMMLVSIPESNMEIGGEGGKATLDFLAKTIGRIESVWKPITATESFEIVRRRLFSSEVDYAARDAVLRAFREMYVNNATEFPSGVGEGDYYRRMQEAYPIHPELFARLYEDWSTLERFQRTRGVLRLMATVIHRLWTDNDQSLLIMPSSIPLFASSVRHEMLRYLPENWSAIVDTDIDGLDSKPYQIDSNNPTQGQYTASRRVARSIFIGSAPSVAGQSVRGIEEVRIRLATAQPGEQLAVFNDALRRMSNQLMYLYTDGSRYWYDTRPTVNRMAQDRAQNIHPDLVYKEAIERLRGVKYRREDFNSAHIAPQSSADVADEWHTRVVVLDPSYGHRRNDESSDALKHIQDILLNRGNAPRLYRNMLIFIAPDANDVQAWEKALREYLAWKSIQTEADQINLDTHQRKQVEANLQSAEKTVLIRLQESYSWLIVPAQPDPLGPIEYQAHRINGQDSFYDRAIRKLRQSELLITRWSPDNLRMELDQYLWREQLHLGIKQLWEYLARYCYLPRLYNEDVLMGAIRDGVTRADPPFGYATLISSDNLYKGLIFGQSSTQIYFDDKSLLIRPEIAQKQLDIQNQPKPPTEYPTQPTPLTRVATGFSSSNPTPRPKIYRRYHGTVTLNPQRANKEMGMIVEEIIQRLTSLTDTDVTITLEISANRPSGFDDATVRTIGENSRTLKFNHDFEE